MVLHLARHAGGALTVRWLGSVSSMCECVPVPQGWSQSASCREGAEGFRSLVLQLAHHPGAAFAWRWLGSVSSL